MYKCWKCGDEIEELNSFEEHHPYGESYATETLYDCDCRCGGEYLPVIGYCKCCHEPITEHDFHSYEEVCDSCVQDLRDWFTEEVGKAIREKFTQEQWDLINDVAFEGECVLENFRY